MVQKPGWLADAVAHPDGYYTVDGEKLKGVMLAPQQIADWNSDVPTAAPVMKAAPAPMETPEPMTGMSTEEAQDLGREVQMEMLTEAPTTMMDLESMSKRELEDLGREHGVELDRREKKSTLVEQIKSIIS
tara:strand:- start:10609 stop:11001 length:393 start_codon:yes stop_codon:yes gene_type:complete